MFCAASCGVTAVICGSPVDVLKTRVMNAPVGMYKNPIDCAYKTLINEGPLAFYKGFWLNCMRLGSWTTVCFVTLEWLKEKMEI